MWLSCQRQEYVQTVQPSVNDNAIATSLYTMAELKSETFINIGVLTRQESARSMHNADGRIRPLTLVLGISAGCN